MALLSQDERLDVVGHAADGAEAVSLTESLRPDLVLMDISMPRMDGIEAARRIKQQVRAPSILMLTTLESRDDVRRAAAAGADGYLTKRSASSDLVTTIVEIASLAQATFFGVGRPNGSA